MTYAFTHMGNFLLLLESGLLAGIWILRLKYGPQGWDLGLKAGIWASRLRYGPSAWRRGGTKKEEEKDEKIPLCESIGHRPLRGRCPKRRKEEIIQEMNKFFPTQTVLEIAAGSGGGGAGSMSREEIVSLLRV